MTSAEAQKIINLLSPKRVGIRSRTLRNTGNFLLPIGEEGDKVTQFQIGNDSINYILSYDLNGRTFELKPGTTKTISLDSNHYFEGIKIRAKFVLKDLKAKDDNGAIIPYPDGAVASGYLTETFLIDDPVNC